jgi:hypothetical protein
MAHTGATVDGSCVLTVPVCEEPLTVRLFSDDSFAVLAQCEVDQREVV